MIRNKLAPLAAVLFAMALVLSSCVNKDALINKSKWEPKDKSSIILIGSESSVFVINAIRASKTGPPIVRLTRSLKKLKNTLGPFDVFVVTMEGAGNFKVWNLRYCVGSSDFAGLLYSFENLPEISIDTPGVYYYGTFINKGSKVGFTNKFDQRILDVLESRYPGLLDRFERKNF